jgi:hypothetical protein
MMEEHLPQPIDAEAERIAASVAGQFPIEHKDVCDAALKALAQIIPMLCQNFLERRGADG